MVFRDGMIPLATPSSPGILADRGRTRGVLFARLPRFTRNGAPTDGCGQLFNYHAFLVALPG